MSDVFRRELFRLGAAGSGALVLGNALFGLTGERQRRTPFRAGRGDA